MDAPAGIEVVEFGPSDLATAQHFAKIRPAVTYGLRKFPSPDQYRDVVADLRSTGLDASSRVFAMAQRDWHIRGQTGCMFARLAALAADKLRWDYVIAAEPVGMLDFGLLARRIESMVTAPGAEVVSVLAPTLRDGAEVEAFVRRLAVRSMFWLGRDECVEGVQRLHFRYPIVGRQGVVQAWVMAFGPFAWIPNTRRGPYLELAIRVREKSDWIFHRLNQDREVAHLADIPLHMSAPHWEDRWHSTLRRTRMILEGEPDDVSAAKCTLAIPRTPDTVSVR